MKEQLRNIFNRNNFYKTVHHIKNGNVRFVVQKFLQVSNMKVSFRKSSNCSSAHSTFFDFMFEQNNQKDKEYKHFVKHPSLDSNIKTIAFYLPQFHPISENDKNWGKGFTEWTNVSKALPQFYGHYQPRLPGEMGFYDLRLKEIQKRQIELAKNYGIDGFCFHFYWFNGRRVLEKPLEQFVNDKSMDFSFCINWANENWTRRWDGLDGEILLEQNYSDEDDIEFIKTVSELFKDARYIRVDGKPLLMIYRTSLFPDIKATALRWRKYCKENGIGEIYLVLTHSFEHEDPREIGFDAAVEFSPNTFSVPVQNKKQKFYNHAYNGMVFDYDDAISYSLEMKTPTYKKFKTVFPSWDNEARKPGAGTSFVNSSPKKYEMWLKNIYRYTKENLPESEQIVFVNAWNEWAEGAYLEPDRKFGYAYLEATYNAKSFYDKQRDKIIVISHDAYLHGAQYLALNIAKKMLQEHHCEVTILLNGEGPLTEAFEEIGEVYKLYKLKQKEKKFLYKKLYDEGIRYAIANTATVGGIVKELKMANISSISLIHEMENVIRQYNLQNSLENISLFAQKVIFPSIMVKNDFEKFVSLESSKALIRPQGLFRENSYKNQKEVARKKLRHNLLIDENTFIVLNIAYGDLRKGMDIFVETGLSILEQGYEVHFVWGGHYEDALYQKVLLQIKSTKFSRFFHFTGFLKDIDYFYAGSDLFFLSSREDPFPSVVMDAMNVGLPVLGFEGAGGFTELLHHDQGILVPYLDTDCASKVIIELLNDKQKYMQISYKAMKKIEKEYNFSNYVQALLDLRENKTFKVSVVIPNYNYEKYIVKRIESVINQTYPIHEIIFLDDASSDNSVKMAEQILSISNIPYKVIKNIKNSGSVFAQWAKGVRMAKGEYIWIAEADDWAEKTFLEKVMQGFDTEDTIISYAQSKMIDSEGKILANDYLSYTSDIDPVKWTKNYNILGREELATSMVIKNTIPNVSAVVFKHIDVESILIESNKFKVAGDWCFYAELLKFGRIAFIAEALNYHRRHNNSVTGSLDNQKHYEEIVHMQEKIAHTVEISATVKKKYLLYRKYIKKHLGIQ